MPVPWLGLIFFVMGVFAIACAVGYAGRLLDAMNPRLPKPLDTPPGQTSRDAEGLAISIVAVAVLAVAFFLTI